MSRDKVQWTPGGRSLGLFRSIRTKLILSFCALFVVVLALIELLGVVGVPWTSYTGRRGNDRDEAFRSLNLVADLKKSRLQRMFKERREDLQLFAGNPTFRLNVGRLLGAYRRAGSAGLSGEALWAAVRQEESYSAVSDYLRSISTAFGVFHEIFIADAETERIIVSTEKRNEGTRAVRDEHDVSSASVRVPGTTMVSDIHIDARTNLSTIHFGRAIVDPEADTLKGHEGAVGAVLVLDLDPDDFITPMLHTGEGLGRTGEALLVNQQGRIVTSLKHRLADGTRAKLLEYRIKAQPAVLAAGGEEGIIEAEDYRGEPVLAAYRHIRVMPDWGWGLVVKRDQAELFANMRRDLVYSLAFGAAGVALLVVLTVIVAGALTEPIIGLSKAADRVARGDLAARAPVGGSDEIGILAVAFNSMVERIQHWHEELNTEVKIRTAELDSANKKLRTEIAERESAQQATRKAQEDLLARQRRETELAEAELDKLRAELVRRTRLATLGQLAGSVAHELRNPLGAVRNAAFFLKGEVADRNPKWAKHLAVIDEEVNTADRIIRDLLEMSRAKVPHREQVELGEVLQAAWERANVPEGVRRRINLAPQPFGIIADRTQLGQVLANMLTNARQAMDGEGEICVEARREGAHNVIVIRDTGPGVPVEDRERIFEPLYSTKAKGTGLGLSISREIVERHGGTLELLEDGGSGAAFGIRLPREDKRGD